METAPPKGTPDVEANFVAAKRAYAESCREMEHAIKSLEEAMLIHSGMGCEWRIVC